MRVDLFSNKGMIVKILALFSLVLLNAVNARRALNSEFEKYRAYESFVELKGGDFLMGTDDRDGINHEYPQRKASVKPFRFLFLSYILNLNQMIY